MGDNEDTATSLAWASTSNMIVARLRLGCDAVPNCTDSTMSQNPAQENLYWDMIRSMEVWSSIDFPLTQ